MAKKTGRINVAMQCKECKKTNYFTELNKNVTAKLESSKHCKQCRKRTIHVSKEKLK